MWRHQNKRSHGNLINHLEQEKLFMEIDEEIGEMIVLNEDNFIPFSERVKNILGKVQYKAKNRLFDKRKQEVEHFIKVISQGSKTLINPEKTKNVKGLVD
jgi:hypothetical protein